jgi:hypothetical protein
MPSSPNCVDFFGTLSIRSAAPPSSSITGFAYLITTSFHPVIAVECLLHISDVATCCFVLRVTPSLRLGSGKAVTWLDEQPALLIEVVGWSVVAVISEYI